MNWIIAIELLALIICAWRIGSKVAAVASVMREAGADDDGE